MFTNIMSKVRASSSPELVPSSSNNKVERPDSPTLEGVATNVMLLLKLVQDHNEASTKDSHDDRKKQRVAGMMTILDEVKNRIQKSQSFPVKRREAELRRCNTDLRPHAAVPRDHSKRPNEPQPNIPMDEKTKLRKELNASLAARKSLEIMCSSLGKEKEIMATELARKVHELNGMEELINDLKAQNEMLLAKVQTCAAQHKDKKSGGGGGGELQERNRALSEQLLKSLDGYRSLKRKLKEAQEENGGFRGIMEEMGVEVGVGLERLRSFQKRMMVVTAEATKIDDDEHEQEEEQQQQPATPVAIEEEISALEHMLECFEMKVSQNRMKKPKPEMIKPIKPSVLA